MTDARRATRRRRPGQPLDEWVRSAHPLHPGIAHRNAAIAAGYPVGEIREAIALGVVSRQRRYWLSMPAADRDFVLAARATARVACVSAARARGWWVPPEDPHDARVHLRVAPGAESPRAESAVHWTRPLVVVDPWTLIESIEDTLQHVAGCLPHEGAMAVWESAARRERLSPEYLALVPWRTPAARHLADGVTGLMDSGIETRLVLRLRRTGIVVRSQAQLAGHPVDALIGERLVIQADGHEFHSSARDRARDVAHDAELAARGYTVLRFTYHQIVHEWPMVERAVLRAMAVGVHLAR